MYAIRFTYEDKHFAEYEDVEKAEYQKSFGCIAVYGNDIGIHSFPFDTDLHIISKKKDYFVPHTGLSSIDIIHK